MRLGTQAQSTAQRGMQKLELGRVMLSMCQHAHCAYQPLHAASIVTAYTVYCRLTNEVYCQRSRCHALHSNIRNWHSLDNEVVPLVAPTPQSRLQCMLMLCCECCTSAIAMADACVLATSHMLLIIEDIAVNMAADTPCKDTGGMHDAQHTAVPIDCRGTHHPYVQHRPKVRGLRVTVDPAQGSSKVSKRYCCEGNADQQRQDLCGPCRGGSSTCTSSSGRRSSQQAGVQSKYEEAWRPT
jgi:hypothetical protein